MEDISKATLEYSTLYCCYYQGCNNQYSTKFNLKHHIETIHLKTKRFICEICQKCLSSKQNYKKHMSIHKGAKPFACNYCGKCYIQEEQLSIHKRVHNKDGKKVSVEAIDTASIKIARFIMKQFEKITWEELESNQPQLPILQRSYKQLTNLPSFYSILKKLKKENNI
ncbi:unnamed protein product [Blepharisma stoltei]|uniref:C2H2-type domain-containing protein n=1 Tax=Blepharisma stoltei TaxID=1481888 RepID=A0AAU9JDB7_9CILI|nr:unnamed protein product [Blepharisma stoltei]